jgi:hypothetical protein
MSLDDKMLHLHVTIPSSTFRSTGKMGDENGELTLTGRERGGRRECVKGKNGIRRENAKETILIEFQRFFTTRIS